MHNSFQLLFIGALLSTFVPAHGQRLDLIGCPKARKTPRPFEKSLLSTSPLRDDTDFTYFTNITLGGVVVEVQIDTGSNDLWVVPQIQNGQSTDRTSSVAYAKGHAEGTVSFAPLEFASHSVPQQAFLQINTSLSTDLGADGLIGLSPDAVSHIFRQNKNLFNTNAGNPPLATILSQNVTMPHILTFTLGRDNTPSSNPVQGTLTVGEILPGMEAVNSQPKLPIVPTVPITVGSENVDYPIPWSVLLDKDGIKVNGKTVTLPKSSVNNSATPDQLVVTTDTGFTLPQVPTAVTDAMYASLPGAKFGPVGGSFGSRNLWTVPCDAEINMTLTFGGEEIPIHPLDTSFSSTFIGDSGASDPVTCFGSWQPNDNISDVVGSDAVLGMVFLRNVYVLIEMGNLVGTMNTGFDSSAQAFKQLLPTTDPAKAHEEFVAARLNGTSSNNDPSAGSTTAGGGGSGDKKSNTGELLSWHQTAMSLGTVLMGGLLALV